MRGKLWHWNLYPITFPIFTGIFDSRKPCADLVGMLLGCVFAFLSVLALFRRRVSAKSAYNGSWLCPQWR